MKLAFVILLDRFNDRDAPGQRGIEDIAASARAQAHAIPALDFSPRDLQAVHPVFIFEQVPLVLVHSASSLTGRIPRSTPWSFIMCSGGSDSVRSRIWRARSSPRRISCFSSS